MRSGFGVRTNLTIPENWQIGVQAERIRNPLHALHAFTVVIPEVDYYLYRVQHGSLKVPKTLVLTFGKT